MTHTIDQLKQKIESLRRQERALVEQRNSVIAARGLYRKSTALHRKAAERRIALQGLEALLERELWDASCAGCGAEAAQNSDGEPLDEIEKWEANEVFNTLHDQEKKA
jgi:hypothetical protein